MGIFTPLADPAVFRTVINRGRKAGCEGVNISVLDRGPGGVRLGLAVKAPDAVTRNRIKRRLRAALHEAVSSADVGSVDVVVRARPPADRIAFQELVKTAKVGLGTPR